MNKLLMIFISIVFLLTNKVKADEGMWMLPLLQKLNYATMKEMGLELSPEQVYSINSSSLKDAIVIFGRGCTGEIISKDGLLLTNHHCGHDEIQNHSLGANNYLRDGFWAMNRAEELPNPGLSVTFLISIEEVTDKVLKNVSKDMTESERNKTIAELSGKLEADAVKGTHYEANVRSFFKRNRYFLFVFERFLDIRLVGAPPESIGNFGDETDNWMWPRHTGDFSMFRVYTGPDGKPAGYSPDNIPLKAKYHLPISLKGIKDGDFTMILGNPGSTQRYISSWGLEEVYNITNPNRIQIRGARQDILKKAMHADEKVNAMYSTKYQRSSNYWKYSIGQNRGIKRLDLISKKQAEERAFVDWVNADDKRKKVYGGILDTISSYYGSRKEAYSNLQKLGEVFYRGIELTSIASDVFDVFVALKDNVSTEELKKTIGEFKTTAESFYKEYHMPLDKQVAVELLKVYAEMTPSPYRPDVYGLIYKKYKGSYSKYAEKLYSKSMFADPEKLNSFLDNPSLNQLVKDPGFQLIKSVEVRRYIDLETINRGRDEFDKSVRLYMDGRITMNPDRNYYPDANFTMRLTYGKVGDYAPADAVKYNYYTTLRGVMEKEDPSNPEFVVHQKLKKLFEEKDYGHYGENGYMPVCFTSNNDITGGNSGSPVLNGKGELIGLAFDGNWEAMSGDIVFEDEIQKTINVDIRYVLFVIDKFAGAGHLVEEMTIN